MKHFNQKGKSQKKILSLKDYFLRFEHNGYYYTVSLSMALPHIIAVASVSQDPEYKMQGAVIESRLTSTNMKDFLEYIFRGLRKYVLNKCHKKR